MAHRFLLAKEQPLGPLEGLGPLGGENNPLTTKEAAVSTFTKVISIAIGVMTIIAFIWFLFVLFIGAIGWLGSEGDKAKVQEAQKKITRALVGLVIVIAAIFIVKLVEVILGIKILSISDLLLNIWK